MSITTVIFIFVIAGSFFTLAKQYPPKFVPLDQASSSSKTQNTSVEGYTRPGSIPPDTSQDQGGAKQIDLLAELSQEEQQLLQQRFDQAASLLHAGQYEYAITALKHVVKIQPKMPEAYVNFGYAYLGLKQYQASAVSFSRAIELRPNQVNAYYGLAEALEKGAQQQAFVGNLSGGERNRVQLAKLVKAGGNFMILDGASS